MKSVHGHIDGGHACSFEPRADRARQAALAAARPARHPHNQRALRAAAGRREAGRRRARREGGVGSAQARLAACSGGRCANKAPSAPVAAAHQPPLDAGCEDVIRFLHGGRTLQHLLTGRRRHLGRRHAVVAWSLMAAVGAWATTAPDQPAPPHTDPPQANPIPMHTCILTCSVPLLLRVLLRRAGTRSRHAACRCRCLPAAAALR